MPALVDALALDAPVPAPVVALALDAPVPAAVACVAGWLEQAARRARARAGAKARGRITARLYAAPAPPRTDHLGPAFASTSAPPATYFVTRMITDWLQAPSPTLSLIATWTAT